MTGKALTREIRGGNERVREDKRREKERKR
jgi:hypothetical protein